VTVAWEGLTLCWLRSRGLPSDDDGERHFCRHFAWANWNEQSTFGICRNQLPAHSSAVLSLLGIPLPTAPRFLTTGLFQTG
jgi:hypothetical protein